MFFLPHACRGVSRPRAVGSQPPEKGLPGDEGSGAQLGLWVHAKHDSVLHRGAEREATTISWLGTTSLLGETHDTPTGLTLHGAAAESCMASAPSPPPLATMVLRMPRGGHSGLGWLLKLNNVLIQQSTTTVWGESRLIKWTLNSTF